MTTSDDFRKRAKRIEGLVEEVGDTPEKKRLKRLAEGLKSAAETQAWLDGEKPPTTLHEPSYRYVSLTQRL